MLMIMHRLVFLIKHNNDYEHINLGYSEEISIIDLADLVSIAIGFKANIFTKPNRPDDKLRKLLNSSKLRSLD